MSESIEKQKIEIAVQEKELNTKEFFAGFSKPKRYLFFALVILIIPIFFITKYSVAAIYIRSFAKTQITSHPAIVEALPVSVIQTKALTMVGDSYAAYALVKNPNKDLVTKELKYTFTFYNQENVVLGSSTDKTYLLGGEQKYLILPNIKLKEKPSNVKLEIADPSWKRRLDIPNILVKAGIPTYTDVTDPVGFQLTGSIQNLSKNTIGATRVSAIVFDKTDTIIAVNQRVENALKPQEVRDYKMYWAIPLAAEASGIPQIIVETNVLDLENIK